MKNERDNAGREKEMGEKWQERKGVREDYFYGKGVVDMGGRETAREVKEGDSNAGSEGERWDKTRS